MDLKVLKVSKVLKVLKVLKILKVLIPGASRSPLKDPWRPSGGPGGPREFQGPPGDALVGLWRPKGPNHIIHKGISYIYIYIYIPLSLSLSLSL